jgi:hypothetical protein
MPDVNITRVNRVPYSWNSCAHFFNGLPYKGLTAVSYKESREVKLVHAAQQDGTPLGITAGVYKVENLSFTFLRDSWAALAADLTLAGLGSYGDAEFTYILSVFEPAVPPSLPIQTILTGIRITGVEEKHAYGADELTTEVSAQAMFCLRTVAGVPLQLWSAVRALL